MKKELKDYLHLLIGVECKMVKPSYHAVHELHLSSGRTFILTGKLCDYFSSDTTKAEIKPILRPLSDMTHEDIKEWDENVTITSTPYCVEIDSKDNDGEFTEVYPDGSILSRSKDDGDIRPINGGLLFILLLKQGFDLFGLIPADLAIDKTKL